MLIFFRTFQCSGCQCNLEGSVRREAGSWWSEVGSHDPRYGSTFCRLWIRLWIPGIRIEKGSFVIWKSWSVASEKGNQLCLQHRRRTGSTFTISLQTGSRLMWSLLNRSKIITLATIQSNFWITRKEWPLLTGCRYSEVALIHASSFQL